MGMTIIKNYGMPHNCYDCDLHNYHECDLTGESIEEDYCWNGDSREKHCPLREVEAIEALEQESTAENETLVSLGAYKQVAWERDIAIQQLHELGYEFGQKKEPTTKNDLGVDCISREQAINAVNMCSNSETILNLQQLPSVTPQEPKTGYWINKQRLFDSCSAECSSCHKRSNGYVSDNGYSLECKYFNFCPNCGCRMVEP